MTLLIILPSLGLGKRVYVLKGSQATQLRLAENIFEMCVHKFYEIAETFSLEATLDVLIQLLLFLKVCSWLEITKTG